MKVKIKYESEIDLIYNLETEMSLQEVVVRLKKDLDNFIDVKLAPTFKMPDSWLIIERKNIEY